MDIFDIGFGSSLAFGHRSHRVGEDVGVAGADYAPASPISAEMVGAGLADAHQAVQAKC